MANGAARWPLAAAHQPLALAVFNDHGRFPNLGPAEASVAAGEGCWLVAVTGGRVKVPPRCLSSPACVFLGTQLPATLLTP